MLFRSGGEVGTRPPACIEARQSAIGQCHDGTIGRSLGEEGQRQRGDADDADTEDLVTRGQLAAWDSHTRGLGADQPELGRSGKEGGSGGWSHLHFEIVSRQPSGEWGTQEGFAFLWEAYLEPVQY